MSVIELTDEQKMSAFLGFLQGYFHDKYDNQKSVIDLQTEIFYRFCQKHGVKTDEKLYEKMSNIGKLILTEQFDSIITELMGEDFKLKGDNN